MDAKVAQWKKEVGAFCGVIMTRQVGYRPSFKAHGVLVPRREIHGEFEWYRIGTYDSTMGVIHDHGFIDRYWLCRADPCTIDPSSQFVSSTRFWARPPPELYRGERIHPSYAVAASKLDTSGSGGVVSLQLLWDAVRMRVELYEWIEKMLLTPRTAPTYHLHLLRTPVPPQLTGLLYCTTAFDVTMDTLGIVGIHWLMRSRISVEKMQLLETTILDIRLQTSAGSLDDTMRLVVATELVDTKRCRLIDTRSDDEKDAPPLHGLRIERGTAARALGRLVTASMRTDLFFHGPFELGLEAISKRKALLRAGECLMGWTATRGVVRLAIRQRCASLAETARVSGNGHPPLKWALAQYMSRLGAILGSFIDMAAVLPAGLTPISDMKLAIPLMPPCVAAFHAKGHLKDAERRKFCAIVFAAGVTGGAVERHWRPHFMAHYTPETAEREWKAITIDLKGLFRKFATGHTKAIAAGRTRCETMMVGGFCPIWNKRKTTPRTCVDECQKAIAPATLQSPLGFMIEKRKL